MGGEVSEGCPRRHALGGSPITAVTEHGEQSRKRRAPGKWAGVRWAPERGTDAPRPEQPAPRNMLDGAASPRRPPHRSLYLNFGIGDGGQILGVMGHGDGPDALIFGAAVEYGVHRDPVRQGGGQAFAGFPGVGAHSENMPTAHKSRWPPIRWSMAGL